jgi:trehalose-6-phosphatase
MQVFGFAPAELAATQEQIGAKFAISDKLRSRRTALLTNLYTAMTAGDDQATQEAFEAIDKFNSANPMIGINPRSIQASFRERNRRAMEAINGIYLPRNLLATTEEYMADLD